MKKFGILFLGLLFVVNANHCSFNQNYAVSAKIFGYGILGAGFACGAIASFLYQKQCKTAIKKVCENASSKVRACYQSGTFDKIVWRSIGILNTIGAGLCFLTALKAINSNTNHETLPFPAQPGHYVSLKYSNIGKQ